MRLLVVPPSIMAVLGASPAPATDGTRLAQARPNAATARTSGGERMSSQRYAFCEAKFGSGNMREGWMRNRCQTAPFGTQFEGTRLQAAWHCLCDWTSPSRPELTIAAGG